MTRCVVMTPDNDKIEWERWTYKELLNRPEHGLLTHNLTNPADTSEHHHDPENLNQHAVLQGRHLCARTRSSSYRRCRDTRASYRSGAGPTRRGRSRAHEARSLQREVRSEHAWTDMRAWCGLLHHQVPSRLRSNYRQMQWGYLCLQRLIKDKRHVSAE